ncbi:MAG: hypothetical protein WA432_01085 [Candidatus Babeliaceae bacterium]
MKNDEIIIACKKVKFYASYDEDAFFEWLKKIKGITDVKGRRDSISIFVNVLSNEDLYNLVGLFRRYKVKMSRLEQVLNKSQQKLFHKYQKGHHINMYPAN